jgi:hypothetical protein
MAMEMGLDQKAIIVAFAIGAIGCTPDDNERCDAPYRWDGENCVKDDDDPRDNAGSADSKADIEIKTDAGDEADADSENNAPEGLGTSCTQGGAECDGFEASYCTSNPMAPDGYCTITDCSSSARDCPGGYLCCEMTVGAPPVVFCATEADFETLLGIGLCKE